MNDNNILDQDEAAGKVVDVAKIKATYQVCFTIFGLAYGFILVLMYGFSARDFRKFLGLENETVITFIIVAILGLAIVSFLTAVFFRLKRAYYLPLKDKSANRRAAATYFGLAIAVFLGAWAGFQYLNAEHLGALIGFKKRVRSPEFGYFALFGCWAVAGMYTLLAGLQFRQP